MWQHLAALARASKRCPKGSRSMRAQVSLVIPSFNSAPLLARTLSFLARCQEPEFEVVVVDDGSTDDTSSVVERAKRRFRSLTYVHRPRDELSCRARARNVGIEKSTGDSIVFLDSSVLVSPSFVTQVAAAARKNPQAMLLHPVLGLFADPSQLEDGVLCELAPDNLEEACRELASRPLWRDVRSGVGPLLSVDPLTARYAWTLGWTAAMTVSREALLAVDGFDVDFTRWGAEDIDLSYRLWRSGVSFEWVNVSAIHWPHSVADRSKTSHKDNLRRLHQKWYAGETELTTVLWALECCVFGPRLERLVIEQMLPDYSATELNWLARELRTDSMLLVAPVSPKSIEVLNPSWTLVPNQLGLEMASSGGTAARRLQRGLGLDTPFGTAEFSLAVVSDLVRLLPVELQRAQLGELKRVARRVLLATSAGLHPVQASLLARAGWELASDEALQKAVGADELCFREIGRHDQLRLMELCELGTRSSV